MAMNACMWMVNAVAPPRVSDRSIALCHCLHTAPARVRAFCFRFGFYLGGGMVVWSGRHRGRAKGVHGVRSVRSCSGGSGFIHCWEQGHQLLWGASIHGPSIYPTAKSKNATGPKVGISNVFFPGFLYMLPFWIKWYSCCRTYVTTRK